MAEQTLKVIKVWAALIWADGLIAKKEGDALRRLIETSDLTDDERDSAWGFLEEEVALDDAGLAELSAPEREDIYRSAVRLAAVDDDIADEEIDFLGRLRRALALDDALAEQIEDGVAAEHGA
ncbi:MAG TPA: hypothetical protein VKE22_29145 [Haliangiales bacterium]|nr:hypothetical protein [Haliangiales bacterium]